jgi:hypothetical protein
MSALVRHKLCFLYWCYVAYIVVWSCYKQLNNKINFSSILLQSISVVDDRLALTNSVLIAYYEKVYNSTIIME